MQKQGEHAGRRGRRGLVLRSVAARSSPEVAGTPARGARGGARSLAKALTVARASLDNALASALALTRARVELASEGNRFGLKHFGHSQRLIPFLGCRR